MNVLNDLVMLSACVVVQFRNHAIRLEKHQRHQLEFRFLKHPDNVFSHLNLERVERLTFNSSILTVVTGSAISEELTRCSGDIISGRCASTISPSLGDSFKPHHNHNDGYVRTV